MVLESATKRSEEPPKKAKTPVPGKVEIRRSSGKKLRNEKEGVKTGIAKSRKGSEKGTDETGEKQSEGNEPTNAPTSAGTTARKTGKRKTTGRKMSAGRSAKGETLGETTGDATGPDTLAPESSGAVVASDVEKAGSSKRTGRRKWLPSCKLRRKSSPSSRPSLSNRSKRKSRKSKSPNKSRVKRSPTLFKRQACRRGKNKKSSSGSRSSKREKTKTLKAKKSDETEQQSTSASVKQKKPTEEAIMGSSDPSRPASIKISAATPPQPGEDAATATGQSTAYSTVQDRGGLLADHREAVALALDTTPERAFGAVSFSATGTHVPRSTSRSRRRSTSRSGSRVQIPGHKLSLVAPLFIRSFQTVHVEQETEELTVCSSVMLHSYGMTFEERKAELENLVHVPPPVTNVKTMDDDGFQDEKTTQNVYIGNKLIIIERRSTLLRGEQDCGLQTYDVRKYDNVAKARMGPSQDSPNTKSVDGVLNIIAQNGTCIDGDEFHKTERIMLNIGGMTFEDFDNKKHAVVSEQSISQKKNVTFKERIFVEDSSITIDRDTVVNAKDGAVWNRASPLYVEERRSYDYHRQFEDGSLVWTGVAPMREDVTQGSDNTERKGHELSIEWFPSSRIDYSDLLEFKLEALCTLA
ncbi:hypothetical protein GCK32_003577 [Trichostrongylus colubriformis]|uniref:Uncharacterized protein n=1 Tax=Trichostrongylus colubriformis TaxID=6319 RepID=A0AAN8IRC7_TRICO